MQHPCGDNKSTVTFAELFLQERGDSGVQELMVLLFPKTSSYTCEFLAPCFSHTREDATLVWTPVTLEGKSTSCLFPTLQTSHELFRNHTLNISQLQQGQQCNLKPGDATTKKQRAFRHARLCSALKQIWEVSSLLFYTCLFFPDKLVGLTPYITYDSEAITAAIEKCFVMRKALLYSTKP